MKKFLLFCVSLIFIANFLSAQVAGDYRSISPFGNWSAPASWQRYDGATWLAATDYPGQNPGAGAVTIQNANIITFDISPANAVGSLVVQGTTNNTLLIISDGFTLNVTGLVQINPATSGGPLLSTIIMNGPTAQLNCGSLTLVESGADNRASVLVFTDGIVNVTGNITMGATQPQRTIIQFATLGTLNVGGNVIGGTITSGTGTINFNGSGTQTIGNATPITLYNMGMTNAASTLQLNGNITVSNTLALTNGKINTQTNTLTLTNTTPATQLTGVSSSSYVYSSGAGRLQRNGLAAATLYNFPVGTSTNYMPVSVTPTTVSDFAVNVFSPATTNGVEGGPAFTDKTKIVDAVWNIDRPVGSGNTDVTIQWVDALEGSAFVSFGNSQIGVSRFSGTWSAAIANSANAAANTVTATFNAFSPFGVGQLGVALPVKFGPIKAYEKQNGIEVDWKVYSENKVKNYEVERSADGRSYTTVGSLPALYNNTSGGDYGFFDANPLPGTSYYRIKNNDLDGKSSYSIVVRVNRNKSIKGLSIYPNPLVNGMVLLQGSDLGRGNYKINIIGTNGQEIYKQQIKHNGGTISQTIELPSTISKGIYILSVRDENGNIIFKEKLVNQ